MPRFVIKLAYDGTNYHGWQVQNNAHTVQAEITEKLNILLRGKMSLTGCGRTDSGVHAREFFAHFEHDSKIISLNDLTFKLNSFLPADIVVYNIWECNDAFNARFTAKSRTYKYYISTHKDPFNDRFSYYYNGYLNIEAMNKACYYIIENNDFTSFSKLHTQTTTNICKVTDALFYSKDSYLVFKITADRFLRNMVRAIVGTLLEIGKGRMELSGMEKIILAKNRSDAGFSVPAQGLFLEKVLYPDEYSYLNQ